MIILKRTGKQIVSEHVVYENPFMQAWGMRFRRPLRDKAIVFSFHNPCTIYADNMFVFCSLDMVWLDEKGRVVDMRYGIKPFIPLVIPRAKAVKMIEFSSGTLKKLNIRLGDVLKLQNGN